MDKSTYTVLHIDNSTFFKKLFQKVLTDQGFSYLPAVTIETAFQVLKTQDVDLIVSAFELEDGTGEDLVTRLNASDHYDIPVLMVTGKDSPDVREKMFSLGVIDYIPKNITEDMLVLYVDRLRKERIAMHRLKGLTIAVLDDSTIELHIIRNILEFHGIENVDYYRDPEELLGSDKTYAIYLLDLILPKVSGEMVLFELRKKHERSVIIAISSIDVHRTISNVLIMGADDYIEKPFNANIFMARLEAHVRTFVLHREIEEKNILLGTMLIRDGLTGLYNHSYFYERLEKEILEAKRYHRKLSIIIFDIDHFKNINDTHGHQMGDQVLKAVADAMAKSLREVDIVARYGGEEFVVILPETGLEEAVVSAERVRTDIEKLSGWTKIAITVSGGVAEYRDEETARLVAIADARLYRAKKNGRNRIVTND